MSYLDERRDFINKGRPLPEPKKPKWLKPVSDKRREKIAAAKEVRGDDDTEKEKWFKARRKDTLVGTCQCGCGRPSSKRDDKNFRSSCCHLFPKKLFPSIALHPVNCVERNFWDGCHFRFDNESMDLWPQMADWDDIKEKCHVLAPLLTEKERAKKFYTHLQKLVYEN